MIYINPFELLGFPNGAVASYQFDGNANDSVGTNHATVITDITYAPGKVNSAAVFNGSTSKITIPDNDVFSFTDETKDLPFSVSILVYFNTVGDCYFVSKHDTTQTNAEYDFYYIGSGLAFYFYSDSTYANKIAYKSQQFFSPNQWYHLVFTFDGVNGQLYRDGVAIPTTIEVTGTYVKMINTTSRISIGRPQFIGGYIINGMIDRLDFFNRKLTAKEVGDIAALNSLAYKEDTPPENPTEPGTTRTFSSEFNNLFKK